MPQTTDEMRAYWGGADDAPALQHLQERGFVERGGLWIAPAGHVYSARDINAIEFLIEEWDYGGVEEGPSPSTAKVKRVDGIWVDRTRSMNDAAPGSQAGL